MSPEEITDILRNIRNAHRTEDHIDNALQQTHVDRLVGEIDTVQRRNFEISANEHEITQTDAKNAIIINFLINKNFNEDDDTDIEENGPLDWENDEDLLEKILEVE